MEAHLKCISPNWVDGWTEGEMQTSKYSRMGKDLRWTNIKGSFFSPKLYVYILIS